MRTELMITTPQLVMPEPLGVSGEALRKYFVLPSESVRVSLDKLDKGGKGIVLIVDESDRLLGTVTDGDIRRWTLAQKSLDAPLSDLVASKVSAQAHRKPVTALETTPTNELLRLMQTNVVHQIPLLNHNQQVVALVVMDDLLPSQRLPLKAVIMAGGFGKRLRPLTDDLPKPMLPMGDRPIMEHIVRQLKSAGVDQVTATTHYMAEKIIEHFGNGEKFGMTMDYVSEDQPLGTAGAIGLLDEPTERLLVMNGDILTGVDLKALAQFHQESNAIMTVGVRTYEFRVPYGVIEREGTFITKLVEKPSLQFFVNAGMYVLEPAAHKYIPKGVRFDMTDLISKLIAEGHQVACFPIHEYWLDIGQMPDYEQAVQDIRSGRYAG